jgi:CotS family spore coat protein
VRLHDLDRFLALAKLGDGRFDRAYADLWPAYRRQAEHASRLLCGAVYEQHARLASARGEICHHDLAHHNVLLAQGLASFVDLDYAVADTALHDLANLCGHVMRLHNWSWEPVRLALASYWEEIPPAADDRTVLGMMLLWPQDYWQIGRQFYDERQPWPTERFMDLLERKCGKGGERRRLLWRYTVEPW